MNKIFEGVLELYSILFGRPRFIRFNRFIFNLSIRGLGIQNYKNFKCSGEEMFMSVLSEMYKNRKLIFFDIGANKGDYVDLILRKIDNNFIDIFVFEPVKRQFNKLKNRFKSPNIHLYDLACGEKNETRTFYDDNRTGEFSGFYTVASDIANKNKFKKIGVKTTRLDDIILKNRLRKINLLKIDTEGSELEVLKGSRKAIDKGIIDIIQFEFNSMNIVNKIFLKDFMSLLRNYSFYRLLPYGTMKIVAYEPLFWEVFSFQNIVAVKNNLVNLFEKQYAQ